MGCDIHPFLEIRKEGKWRLLETSLGRTPPEWYKKDSKDNRPFFEDVAGIIGERNYALFALIGGVRGTSLIGAKPKGLPYDASQEIRNMLDSDDIHSQSYYTLKELLGLPWTMIIKYYDEDNATLKEYFGDLRLLTDIMVGLAKINQISTKDIRLVFGFDN